MSTLYSLITSPLACLILVSYVLVSIVSMVFMGIAVGAFWIESKCEAYLNFLDEVIKEVQQERTARQEKHVG